MKPIAYSYIRFSQISQRKGGSHERQSMSAEEYCDKEGLTLSSEVYEDLGVSGYSGKNYKEGALKEFMEAVEAKKISAGSLLLIEDMDRLTRLPILEGFAVFQRILAGGITLVTLKDGKKYSTESLNQEPMQLFPILVDMSRGWGESERKSVLLGKAWKKKKADAANELKPFGNNCPMWLTLGKNAETGKPEYKEVPHRVAAIKRMFELSASGHGFVSIALALAEEGFKPFKSEDEESPAWGTTTISRTLRNRAVIGEFQPLEGSGLHHTRKKAGPAIPGFFPVIIEKSLFDRVQEAIASRKLHRATKQTPIFNMWQGVGVCGVCSGAMHIDKKGKGMIYLVCCNKWIKKCPSRIVRLEPSERVLAEILVLTGNTSLVADDTAEKEAKLQAAKGRLMDEMSHLRSLEELLGDAPSRTLALMIATQEAKIDATREGITDLEAALAASTIVDRESFFQNLDLTNREVRSQANALLKRLGIKVTLTKHGRYGHVEYAVYQHDKLMMKLREEKDAIEVSSYSPTVTLRLHSQSQIEDHQLEANVPWGKEALLSTRNPLVSPLADVQQGGETVAPIAIEK